MKSKSRRICFLMSDTLSYQTLMREHLSKLHGISQVEVVALYGGDFRRIRDSGLDDYAKFFDMGFVRKPSLFKDTLAFIKCFLHFLFNRYDVIVYSTPKAMLIGAISSYLSLQPKRVCIVRGRAYENYKGFLRKIFLFFDRLTFKCSTDVYFISKSLKEEYGKEFNVGFFSVLGDGSSKGVDVDRFRPLPLVERSLLRSQFGIPENDFVVCVVGRLCADKGVMELSEIIDAVCKQDDQITFLVVGEVEDSFGHDLVKRFSGRDFFKYIEYHHQVEEIFQISDINLFLSHREGFGNVAIEAGSCNVRTLAFDVVGVRDSVSVPETGFRFKVHQSLRVAERLLMIKEEGVPSSTECRDYIIDRFSSTKVFESYCNEVYL